MTVSGGTSFTTTDLDPITAHRIIYNYFNNHPLYKNKGTPILVARKETLATDHIRGHLDEIKHFYGGTPEYSSLPSNIKQAVDVINNLNISLPLHKRGNSLPHVVGWESAKGFIDDILRTKKPIQDA